MSYTYKLQSQGIPVEYIHTPLSYNEDTPINEDRTKGEIIRQNFTLANPYPYNDISHEGYMYRSILWDKALNYKGKTVYDLPIVDLKIKQGFNTLTQDIATNSTAGNLYVIRYLHGEYDSGLLDINTISTYREQIIKNFNTLTNIDGEGVQVAVHIRRKDSIDKENRYIPDSYYIDIIQNLQQYKQKYNITVYSQEVGFTSELYKDCSIVLDTNENDFDTFKKLIHADHLIVGTSSFSYAAALLNKNTVVYHFQGHVPMKNWINVGDYTKLINK